MRNLSNSARSVSYSQTSGATGNFTDSFTGQGYESITSRANAVPINKIFGIYGIKVDEYNRKITCPFKNHKGGRESTASFVYYPETNTYCCFGCKQGNTPVHFVMHMDGCSHQLAALKILNLFSSDIDEDLIIDNHNSNETTKIMIDFSNNVRDFRQQFIDEDSKKFIENICQMYDRMLEKHNMNYDALDTATFLFIENIKKYKIYRENK